MSSVESTEATNSLFMNNPVGTFIVLLMALRSTVADCGIVAERNLSTLIIDPKHNFTKMAPTPRANSKSADLPERRRLTGASLAPSMLQHGFLGRC